MTSTFCNYMTGCWATGNSLEHYWINELHSINWGFGDCGAEHCLTCHSKITHTGPLFTSFPYIKVSGEPLGGIVFLKDQSHKGRNVSLYDKDHINQKNSARESNSSPLRGQVDQHLGRKKMRKATTFPLSTISVFWGIYYTYCMHL